MKLVIVESPTKAKTIKKFLGSGYQVESSFGHIRDLPVSVMGIDLEHDFQPKYVIPTKARKTVTKLKGLAKKADEIILASDEDREGEAIAWHLAEALEIKETETNRIVFHEITKSAIEHALEHPRKLDHNLIDAQQARRVLDRLVGYELSPFLWKKVAKGLSAGRVQSVAVRLIVEREREIQKFTPEEYWSITANLKTKTDEEFTSELYKIDDKIADKLEIKNQEQADKVLSDLNQAEWIVADIEKKQTKKKAPTPFKTSTLQQTANNKLGFSAKLTMMIAQKLYELGYITYMRTDSLNLSSKFLGDAKDYLKNKLGDKYCLTKPNIFKTKAKGAQEAHEAIRPTEASNDPDSLHSKLDGSQHKLYKLIWERSLASQMPDAIVDNTNIFVTAKNYEFKASGRILIFDGYLKIYQETNGDEILPAVKIKEKLELIKLTPEQHFTKPPARYSDATLVKELEKHEIGRPSTYAPTIATIETRNYCQRDEDKRLKPTDIAFVVIDLLVEHFPKIVDLKFTAKMENEFDDIAEGKIEWVPMIREFYEPFHENLKNKEKEINKKDIMPEEKTDEVCDKCGAPMIIKTGRYGKFLACSAFPDCKNIKNAPGSDRDKNGKDDNEEIEKLNKKYAKEVCSKCGAAMTVKVGRFGAFLACTSYPKCKNIKNIEENNNSTGIKCPKCNQGEIVQKRSRKGIFYACNAYPNCKNAYWSKPTGEHCPECDALMVEIKGGAKCSAKECGYTA